MGELEGVHVSGAFVDAAKQCPRAAAPDRCRDAIVSYLRGPRGSAGRWREDLVRAGHMITWSIPPAKPTLGRKVGEVQPEDTWQFCETRPVASARPSKRSIWSAAHHVPRSPSPKRTYRRSTPPFVGRASAGK